MLEKILSEETGSDLKGQSTWLGNSVVGWLKGDQEMANSFFLVFIWALRRATIDECIWETLDSDRSNVAPISFIVISS